MPARLKFANTIATTLEWNGPAIKNLALNIRYILYKRKKRKLDANYQSSLGGTRTSLCSRNDTLPMTPDTTCLFAFFVQSVSLSPPPHWFIPHPRSPGWALSSIAFDWLTGGWIDRSASCICTDIICLRFIRRSFFFFFLLLFPPFHRLFSLSLAFLFSFVFNLPCSRRSSVAKLAERKLRSAWRNEFLEKDILKEREREREKKLTSRRWRRWEK